MQGNIVTAAKWLGASMIIATAVLVGGLQWVFTAGINRLEASVRRAANTAGAGSSPAAASGKKQVDELLKESEALRGESSDSDRFWLLDKPSHLAPFRSAGGLDEDGR